MGTDEAHTHLQSRCGRVVSILDPRRWRQIIAVGILSLIRRDYGSYYQKMVISKSAFLCICFFYVY